MPPCGGHCYLPLYILAGGHLLCARLRTADGSAAAGDGEDGNAGAPGDPRYVVTSLAAGDCPAQELYEELYCERGEMENRIKEQLSLFAGRVSAETMRANQLRLNLAACAE